MARWCGRLSAGWSVGVVAVAAMIISLFFFFPRFWLWPALGLPLSELLGTRPELNRSFFILQQLQDPWIRINDATHQVIEWRLLWPVVGHYTGMPKAVFFALPHLGCLTALGAVAMILWRATHNRIVMLTAVVMIGTCSWFFVSTGWLGYFDSWLILALLLASFAQARGTLFCVALLAPWIDERFIIGLPICGMIRALDRSESGGSVKDRLTDCAVLVAGIAPYLSIRLGFEYRGARETSRDYWASRSIVPASVVGFMLGAWHGLRFGWVLVGAGVIEIWRRKQRWWLGMFAVVVCINLCIADDVSRSASVAVPVAAWGVIVWWRRQRAWTVQLMALLCGANLLFPAKHVIATPRQTALKYYTIPILNFQAEWTRAHNEQPYFASPWVYNELGKADFAVGNMARARLYFDAALKLDPGLNTARANRGMLLFLAGKREEGLAELEMALNGSPWLSDAGLESAGLRRQIGDFAGALRDVRRALPHLPPGPKREKALQLERELVGQIAGAK
jgi:hypothetical protein